MTAAYRSGPDRLVDALLPDGRRVDVTLRGGRIAAIDPHQSESPVPGENALDCGGALVLPAFVAGHCHLDKTFLGAPWQPHRVAGSLRERIANEKALRAQIGVPVAERATALANRMVSLGTGDMLERATIIGLEGSLMTDDELGYAASLITDSAAAVLELDGYGLQPGCRADLVVVEAAGLAEAVAAHPERRWVLHDGRVVAGARA